MLITYLLVAFGLSMDAFAVSVTSGMCIRKLPLFYAIRASLFFGFFQLLMPLIGYLLGSTFVESIKGFDHWIAFVLLGFIGGKMIFESIKDRKKIACDDDEDEAKKGIMNIASLFILSIATSIDALAVGVTYSIARLRLGDLGIAVGIIGLITAVVCMLGFELGKRVSRVFKEAAEIVGGLVLIGIGVKILLDHLVFI